MMGLMRFCIHRGTREIGGTCIEIESQGKRLVLDIGLPLDCVDADSMPLHPVPGFDKPDPSLLGVLISHPHQDHYGLAYQLPPETPFLIGKAAQAILEAADFFTPSGLKLTNVTHLRNRNPIEFGPFTITPYLVDHSAYDSYAVLIEADGKRLFYSGDFRAHGRKAALVEKLIADPPKHVDVLLMEGTTLGRPESSGGFPTEDDLVPRFVELFDQTDGLVLVWASGQNIDRLVTLYKACRRAKRQLILDVYTARVLMATDNPNIPQHTWDGIRIYLPRSQKWRIIRNQALELVEPLKPYRIYPDTIPAEVGHSVMLFRPSMMKELDAMKSLEIGRLIVSVWGGYLKDEKQKPLLDWVEKYTIPLDRCHTSGHADLEALRRMVQAISPHTLIPVHTEQPGRYAEVFDAELKLMEDGCWIQL